MDYKPADFFVGIIDLFGVLIPGAIFTYLHGNYLLCLVGTQLPSGNGMPHIGGFVVVSLLLGHFLLGCSTPLNVLVDIFWKESNDQYYKEVKPDISLPAGREKRRDAYYRAYWFLRIKSAEAIAEVDRQVADYKLFRSLTALFLLDPFLACASGAFTYRRLMVSLAFMLLAGTRYVFLLNWSQRMTFEYYALLWQSRREDPKA